MTSTPQVWRAVLRSLAGEFQPFLIDSWISKLIPEFDGNELRLLAPNAFHKGRVRETLLPTIQTLVCQELDANTTVRVEVGGTDEARRAAEELVREVCGSPQSPPAPLPEGAKPRVRSVRAPSGDNARQSQAAAPLQLVGSPDGESAVQEQRFANFVVGPNNALAREASVAIATQQHPQLNKLYLHSEPGLGKTHLARAVLAEATTLRQRVRYATAEAFTNDFMSAVRARNVPEVMRRYRNKVDLIVIDDIQFLRGKPGTQLELFHTLQELVDQGSRVVLTGDRPATELDLEPQIRDYVTHSFVAPIGPPDEAMRRDVLRQRAAAGGIGLPSECVDTMVEHLQGSMRELESALIQLVTTASLLRRPIDRKLVIEVLATKGAAPAEALNRPTPGRVIEAVARFFDTTPAALASRSRRRDVLVPRQLAMFLCRRFTDAPLAEIGHALGREHSAVRNAIRVVERRITERAPARYQLEAVSERVREALELGSAPMEPVQLSPRPVASRARRPETA